MILSSIYVEKNYLYSPFTFPQGNIDDLSNYSFWDFKKPIVMQAVKWDEGEQSFSHYVTNEEDIKNLLQQFDEARKMEAYSSTPAEDSGAKYSIIFRQVEGFKQVEDWDHDIAQGRNLIEFRFYENYDVIDVSGVHFYELETDFRQDIVSLLYKEKWHYW